MCPEPAVIAWLDGGTSVAVVSGFARVAGNVDFLNGKSLRFVCVCVF